MYLFLVHLHHKPRSFLLSHTAICAGFFDAHTCLLDFSICSIAKGPAEADRPSPEVSAALDGKVRDEGEVNGGLSGKLGPGLGTNMWEAEDRAAEGGVSHWRSQGIYLQTCNSGSLTEQPGPAIVPLHVPNPIVGLELLEPMVYLSTARLRHPGELESHCSSHLPMWPHNSSLVNSQQESDRKGIR